MSRHDLAIHDLEINIFATHDHGISWAIHRLAIQGLAVHGLAINGLAILGSGLQPRLVSSVDYCAIHEISIHNLAITDLSIHDLAIHNLSIIDLSIHDFSSQGDSGGPMIQKAQSKGSGDKWTQVGIVSFGTSAGCEVGLPAGFTR